MNRLSVIKTTSIGWMGGGRRTVLVLGGFLDGASLPGLLAQVRAAADRDVGRVVLDISALVACDREALVELARRRGRLEDPPDGVLDVVGARWSQFMGVLAAEPARNLDALRAVIRELRRPIMLDLFAPRHREATEGLVAASAPKPRGDITPPRPEALAAAAAHGNTGP